MCFVVDSRFEEITLKILGPRVAEVEASAGKTEIETATLRQTKPFNYQQSLFMRGDHKERQREALTLLETLTTRLKELFDEDNKMSPEDTMDAAAALTELLVRTVSANKILASEIANARDYVERELTANVNCLKVQVRPGIASYEEGGQFIKGGF